ncbi:hypothetical protein CBR65_15725 [Cellvibrio sp. PSBB006]|nr:hypothetical protein CBR65_15725 [Cellvibrio sp. PSBB006]
MIVSIVDMATQILAVVWEIVPTIQLLVPIAASLRTTTHTQRDLLHTCCKSKDDISDIPNNIGEFRRSRAKRADVAIRLQASFQWLNNVAVARQWTKEL